MTLFKAPGFESGVSANSTSRRMPLAVLHPFGGQVPATAKILDALPWKRMRPLKWRTAGESNPALSVRSAAHCAIYEQSKNYPLAPRTT